MSAAWHGIPLGEVLTKSEDWIALQPEARYQEVTVRLWGKGVVPRGEVSGAEIAAKSRLRVHADQFIFSRIDARNGAIGVVPVSLDGAVVSSDFPVFNIDCNRLLPAFLGWISKTELFVDMCRAASEGTTNRIRLKEDRFLKTTIPLPPLAEQRRIVAKIDALAANVQEACCLRLKSCQEVESAVAQAAGKVFKPRDGWQQVPLESVCDSIIDCLHSNPVYADDGIPTMRSPDVGWGTLLLSGARKTNEAEYARRTVRGEPREGDIILVREGGGTGKAGIVEKGQKLSLGQRVMMLRSNRDVVEPRFLLLQWLSPAIYRDQIVGRMKGSASPHLNIGALRQFKFFLPPLDEQRRIVAYLDCLQAKVEALKALQAQTAAELDALLPSILDRAFKGEL